MDTLCADTELYTQWGRELRGPIATELIMNMCNADWPPLSLQGKSSPSPKL